MTYIPKQVKQTRERIEAKLDRELVQQLGLYCQYLESDRDYVIAKVLEMVFQKDKGFASWLKDQPGETIAPESARLKRTSGLER